MKLVLAVAAVALFAAPASPSAAHVRYEAAGVRVGSELVSGPALQIKGLESSSLLVSGSSVENLGPSVEVALDAQHALRLEPGLRLERAGAGFVLRSHGPAFVLEAAGAALKASGAVPFTLTPTGFDFGAIGALDGLTLAVKAEAAQAPGQDVRSPEIDMLRARQGRAGVRSRVFKNGNPFVAGAGADKQTLLTLIPISPGGF